MPAILTGRKIGCVSMRATCLTTGLAGNTGLDCRRSINGLRAGEEVIGLSEDTTCLRCDRPGVTKWTINGDGGFSIMWLCAEHEKPVRELVELANKKGKPGRRPSDLPPAVASRRKTVKPLDWTPPK